MTTTTMLPYNREPIDTKDLVCFDPDPGPLPDAMLQEPFLVEIQYILTKRFADFGRRPDVFVSSNTFICYDRSNLNVRVSPDCYVAFGVDAFAIRRRRLYLPWEAGKPPDFALEVASESTGQQDVIGKRRIYAGIGIPEYWRFDPTGGEYHGGALAGDRLVNGEYQPIELTGELEGYSPTLGLSLCWDDGRLTFYDPETGTYLKNMEEEQAAHEATQAALESERAAHEAAQARVRQLEERLRRLQSDVDQEQSQ